MPTGELLKFMSLCLRRGAVSPGALLLLAAVQLSFSGCVTVPSGAGFNEAPIESVIARCRGGDPGKCLEAGNRHRFGNNAPMDVVAASEFYTLACSGDYDYGCKALYEIGIGLLEGKNFRGEESVEDHGKAAELFRLSCEGGYGPGCTSLGVAYREGDGVSKNPSRARELIVLGCEEGSHRGCRLAGDIFIGDDPARGRAFYEKACRWEDSRACTRLGALYLNGTGVAGNPKRAFDYFFLSCSKAPSDNDTEGCFSLARLYEQGVGVAQDRSEAVRYYQQSCSFRPKVADACLSLAKAYKEGAGIRLDANGASQYFRLACELGSAEGCVEWHLDSCRRLGQRDSCEWLDKRNVPNR